MAYGSESLFRELVQDIFIWSTGGNIQFVGKRFFVFSSKLHFLKFGLGFLIFTCNNIDKKRHEFFKNVIVCLLIFIISLIAIASTDANLKVLECTNCKGGIRRLNWTGINYGFIKGASVIISIIPSLIGIAKGNKKVFANGENKSTT